MSTDFVAFEQKKIYIYIYTHMYQPLLSRLVTLKKTIKMIVLKFCRSVLDIHLFTM